MTLSKQDIRETFYGVRSKQDVIDAYKNLIEKLKLNKKKTEENSTVTFKRCDSSRFILEGMKMVQAEMQEKCLLNDETTFEEMADYASKHVRIFEQKE